MRARPSWTLALALLLSSAAPAHAADAPARPMRLGARAGYGVPFGKADDTLYGGMDEQVAGVIPIWLDVGFMVLPNLMLGVYGQYGFVRRKNHGIHTGRGCLADCEAHQLRFGVEALYFFLPEASFDPWLGLGSGYEFYRFETSADSYTNVER
jgi:hypothetical protein